MTIGIDSGSFNPVHTGHVALCDYLVRQGLVDQVWLIRSPLNPFKVESAQTLAPDADRAAMLRIAVRGHKGLRVSTIEDQLPKPNYSINTFHALEEQYLLGAALDVIEYEDMTRDGLDMEHLPDAFRYLLDSPRTVLTPHVAGWTIESKEKLAQVLAQKIIETL